MTLRSTWQLFSDYAIYLRANQRAADAALASAGLVAVTRALGAKMNARLVSGFEDALRGGTLVGFAQALRAAGLTKQEIADRFVEFTFYLRGATRESDEQRVNEVLDVLCGWCDPGARLFPDESDAE